MTFIRLKMSF